MKINDVKIGGIYLTKNGGFLRIVGVHCDDGATLIGERYYYKGSMLILEGGDLIMTEASRLDTLVAFMGPSGFIAAEGEQV